MDSRYADALQKKKLIHYVFDVKSYLFMFL